jgi:hypothetical protein
MNRDDVSEAGKYCADSAVAFRSLAMHDIGLNFSKFLSDSADAALIAGT